MAGQRPEAAIGAGADDVEDAGVAIGVIVGEERAVDMRVLIVRLGVVPVQRFGFIVPGERVRAGEGLPGGGDAAGVAEQGGEQREQEGLEEGRNLDAVPPGVARAGLGVRGWGHGVDIGRFAG